MAPKMVSLPLMLSIKVFTNTATALIGGSQLRVNFLMIISAHKSKTLSNSFKFCSRELESGFFSGELCSELFNSFSDDEPRAFFKDDFNFIFNPPCL